MMTSHIKANAYRTLCGMELNYLDTRANDIMEIIEDSDCSKCRYMYNLMQDPISRKIADDISPEARRKLKDYAARSAGNPAHSKYSKGVLKEIDEDIKDILHRHYIFGVHHKYEEGLALSYTYICIC